MFYLCGPMRGIADLNFPLFERVTKLLRGDGLDILSPHELGDQRSTRGELMAEDLTELVRQCDEGVICLPDWQHSPGASAEVATAFATERPVYEIEIEDDDTYTIRPSTLTSVLVPRELQYAQRIPLIGLCGYAQSGKDTVAAFLVERLGFTRVAFADALRDVLYALNPIVHIGTREGIEGEVRVQRLVAEEGWDNAKVNHQEIRKLLQRLGTEAGREVIHENLWVRLGEDKIEAAGTPVVVTDCRFPNEIQMVQRRGGKMVWIERPGVQAANGHASEHSVGVDDVDYVLSNDGTIEELHEQVAALFASLYGEKVAA